MNIKISLLLFVYIICISCNANHDIPFQIVGKWDFRNLFRPNFEGEDYHLQIGKRFIYDNINTAFNGSYYVFNEDGTFCALHTEGEGGYVKGYWDYNSRDSVLSLNCMNKIQRAKYQVHYIEEGKLSLSDYPRTRPKPHTSYLDTIAANLHSRYTFVKDDYTLGSDYDYTKEEFNTWRKKPDHSENRTEILKRVKQAVAYSIMFIKNNVENDKHSISLNSTNIPIKSCSNGVMMLSQSQLGKWNSIFFNDSEAYVGYRMASNAVSSQLDVPNNKNPIDLNIYLLEEIYKKLDN